LFVCLALFFVCWSCFYIIVECECPKALKTRRKCLSNSLNLTPKEPTEFPTGESEERAKKRQTNAFAFDRSSLSSARSRRRSRRLVLPVFSKNPKVTVTHITYNTAVAADVSRAGESTEQTIASESEGMERKEKERKCSDRKESEKRNFNAAKRRMENVCLCLECQQTNKHQHTHTHSHKCR